MKTKFKSFCLTALLLLFGQSLFAYDFEVNGIFYNITSSTDLTVEVTYDVKYQQTSTYVGDVVIPATVENEGTTYSVTSIGYHAFYGCSGLTGIVIPSSVTSIGNWAFSDCTGLTSIEIPSSVTSIGNEAFWGCTGLTSIEIPSGVTSIGGRAIGSATGRERV